MDTRIFRYVIALLCLALSSVASAANDKATEPVTAGTYEHDPGLSDAYIGLKNNTNYAIKSLSFQISYFDMDGNQLDYEDFNTHTAIEPGLAKKIKIPANEPLRQSWYMRDFKIKFRLKEVNGKEVNGDWQIPSKDKDIEPTTRPANPPIPPAYERTSGFSGLMMVIIMGIPLLGILAGLYVLVASMAKRRNRSAALWVIIALVSTPVLAAVILLCIGSDTRNLPPP
ncbi:MAG TPA: hypothetical protein DC009_07155 [Porphyromonadaceae bacterium]|nr:hypothetical protein [Porphyromonadaceae bacterium]